MRYQERDILTDRAETALERVILRDPEQTWLFDMKQPKAWPHMVRTPVLEAQVKEGDLKVTTASSKVACATGTLCRSLGQVWI